ncbi:MAG TPA: phage Gp37/Gp68 family protein [Verrucomicrobiae bacterium]|nr:phage Gp37/Gp68 family protein [Verrucomicrobiae bacterium]
MGKNSSIEWTHHTFNPWWGCAHVSLGCNNCYAEAWAKRVGENIWGTKSDRRFFTEKHWAEPLKWNADAAEDQIRKRVFCASMADVFELRDDLDPWRVRLWALIEKTSRLDWLLLTKRPQNISAMAPWKDKWPNNVWIGTTVEDQVRANERLPILLKIPAKYRFLSCEPLLGAVDLAAWTEAKPKELHPIDWVIAGGESGPQARAMLPGWACQLRDQCQKAKIPFHFKQWGHWAPVSEKRTDKSRIRKFWDEVTGMEIFMEPKGKKISGRRLDGTTWDQLPSTA